MRVFVLVLIFLIFLWEWRVGDCRTVDTGELTLERVSLVQNRGIRTTRAVIDTTNEPGAEHGRFEPATDGVDARRP